MKKNIAGLCKFEIAGVAQWGVLQGESVFALGEGSLALALEGLRCGDTIAELCKSAASGRALALGNVKLLPPIVPDAKILCVGLNYGDHVAETGRDIPEYPVVFSRFAETFVGHRQSLLRPQESEAFDYEGELAVVIGKSGRRIGEQDAHAHIAGYSLANDATIRDWQFHTHHYLPGKNFAESGALGPAIYPAASVGDLSESELTTFIGDDCLQQDRLSNLLFPMPRLIAYCSSFVNLQAGDIILTGTPSGVGFKREPKRFMQPGDRVKISVQGLPALCNSVENAPVGH